MIKGKYVAIVEVNLSIDENTPNLKPFHQLEKVVKHEITDAIKDMLEDEFGEVGSVIVTQNFADLYRIDGGDGK